MDASVLPSNNDGVAECYLCLDGGLDDPNQPLRRDCSCRGTDAGFVHLKCLADYAAVKSKETPNTNEFNKPWQVCPQCLKNYQNKLRIDIASEFVLFVRRQYPGDTYKQVEALEVKRRALVDRLDKLQPVQKMELGVTANVILSLIDRLKKDSPPLTRRYSQFEGYAYHTHGQIALKEGTEESARRAVAHFEKELEVYNAIGDVDAVFVAKTLIANARSIYEGVNTEEVLKTYKELYELRVSVFGEKSGISIIAGRNYAIQLQKANRGYEACELLTKLQAMSKQNYGPDHNHTKDVESTLKWVVSKINVANQG